MLGVPTQEMKRRAPKFPGNRPNLRPRFAETLLQPAADPFQLCLRPYPLTCKLQGLQAVSLTHSYRNALTPRITEHKNCGFTPFIVELDFIDGDGTGSIGAVRTRGRTPR
jgi:hypothetical protein